MTHRSGAPAALQPDDTAAACDYEVLLDAVYADSKPTPYVGHAPTMDADAPARAGDWLGVRVMHEPSRTFGEVVGRNPRLMWWVRLPWQDGPVLVRGDTLTVATPELEAAVEAERERMRALLGPVKPGSGNRKGGRPHGRKTNQPDDPTIRRCNACGRVLPIEQFWFNNKAANRRAYLCRDCDNRRRRENRARERVQPAGMRRCQACGEVLPLSEFRTDSNRAKGKAYECRKCYNRRMNAYYHRRRYGLAAKEAE